MKRIHAAAMLALTLSGCAGGGFGGGLEPPEVTLADIEFQGAGLVEQRLGLVLRLRNPNEEDLDLDGLKVTLDLDGDRFAAGSTAEDITIPGLDEETVTVDVVSPTADVLAQLRGVTGLRDIDYEISGTAFLKDDRKLPFEEDGTVRLSGLGQ